MPGNSNKKNQADTFPLSEIHHMSQPATEIRINGTVQGVGFRPYIYRLAHKFNLAGHINNSAEGVVITVAGKHEKIDDFVDLIQKKAPPLARIVSVPRFETTLPEGTSRLDRFQ